MVVLWRIIPRLIPQKAKNGRTQNRILPFMKADQTYKPGSVFDNDLSWPQVASRLQPRFRKHDGPPYRFLLVLLRIGFTGPFCLQNAGELLPRLSTLTCRNGRRYISVALSLRSPSAAVSSYPALWSPDFPHISPKDLRRCLVCSALRLNNIAHKTQNNNRS